MSYIILKSNGSQLTEIKDGTINQLSTSLTLVGADYYNYGALLNENFVFLLENFANTNSPDNALPGQLWYDTTINKLRVYNGQEYQDIGGTIASETTPVTSVGDIWIDTTRKQLFFNNGSELTLGGPIYSTTQGVSGFVVEDILDDSGITRTVVSLYVSNVLLGIFSSVAFNAASAISGYTGTTINIGFNVASLSGVKFTVPVTLTDLPVELTDGVNLQTIKTVCGNIGFSLDTTGLSNSDIIDLLTIILPPENYLEDTVCRLHCIDMSSGSRVRTNMSTTIINGVWSELIEIT